MIYAMVTLLAILVLLGSFENPPLPNFYTTGLGLVPKYDVSGG